MEFQKCYSEETGGGMCLGAVQAGVLICRVLIEAQETRFCLEAGEQQLRVQNEAHAKSVFTS